MLRYVLAIAIMVYLTHGFLPGKNTIPSTCLHHDNLPYETPLPVTSLPATSLPATSLPATSLPATSLPASSLPDIVLGPGGVAGFYSLGICHYLLNHFDLKDKRMVGFSAGSFTLLFMRIHPEKRNALLQRIFQCNETDTVKVMKTIMDMLETTTSLEDYDLSGSSIAVSHPGGISLYNTFIHIGQVVRCCKSSSFIPFVTHKSGVDFYDHKFAMDGMVYYKKFLRQYPERPLVITPFTFKRYSNSLYYKILFVFGKHPLKKTSIYQMYLYGYQDARRNHSYFQKYLNPLPEGICI